MSINNDNINDVLSIEKKKISNLKTVKKVEFIMPTRKDYSSLLTSNYTIKQLKEISNHYKIKLGSVNVKSEIVSKIYYNFKLYDNTVIIQRSWRRYLFKLYNKLRGPARFNRSLCVNDTDFFTLDNVKDIPYSQFFSFTDIDNMVYGFDIISIYTLFCKSENNKHLNPYNRNIIPKNVKKNIIKLRWLSNLFNDNITFTMNCIEHEKTSSIESRAISLFHDIDILGSYTHSSWFLDLNKDQLLRFILEIMDIWNYRLNIDHNTKNDICPNYENLFVATQIVDLRIVPVNILQELTIGIMEKLVRNGINTDSRYLGSTYVLSALTLVSNDAASALPWLFQSVL